MRTLIISHGSRGDVQPFAALAIGLSRAGHNVVLASAPFCKGLVAGYNIHFHSFGPNWNEVAQEISNSRESPFTKRAALFRRIYRIRHSQKMYASLIRSIPNFGQYEPDIVIYHPLIPGQSIARQLDVPAITTSLAPGLIPTNSFPHPKFSTRIPRFLNYSTYYLARTRSKLVTPQLANSVANTALQAFSRHILPTASPRYRTDVHTTGFWFCPPRNHVSSSHELADFVNSGDAPIYVGFGSNVSPESSKNGETVKRAIRRAGVRAVVVGGYGGLKIVNQDSDILFLDDAPLDWLFPRVAAIVHHGGSGTTGLALKSGRPQVICPSNYHQFFFANAMHRLGVAPFPQNFESFDEVGLSDSIIQAISTSSNYTAAKNLAEKVREENGVKEAVKVIESFQ